VDVAFRLRINRWQGEERLQLELVGLRPSGGGEVVLQRRERTYWCRRDGDDLLIRNEAGEELRSPASAAASSKTHPYLQGLFNEAALALGLAA